MQERARQAADRRRIFRRFVLSFVPALSLPLVPGMAHAQLAGGIAITSTDTFRGESTAEDDPALVLSANVDTQAGFFAGGSVSIAAGARDPRITSSSQYAGYALRSGETSFEVGVVHRDYHDMVDEAYRKHFFEGFVGVSHKGLKLRLYASPDYLIDSRNTYYIEATARLAQFDQWTLEARGGLSLIPPDPGDTGTQDFEDFTVTLSRPIGKFALTLGLTGTNYPVIGTEGEVKPFISISRAF